MKRIITGLLMSIGVALSAMAAPPAPPAPPASPPTTAAATPGAVPASLALDLVSSLDSVRDPSQDWSVHQSDHFQVIYGQNAQRAGVQAALLEATYARFFEVFDGFGVEPVAEPMTCLFFESKQDYLRYARRIDHVDMSWSVAYYSAKTNRIAFYRYGPTHGSDERRARQVGDDQLYASASTQAEASRSARGHYAHRVSLASATHEAAHQLAFNTGLQRRGVRYPLWVSEGVATNFEMTGLGGMLGPNQDNPDRRRCLERLAADGELEPLRRFIAVTRPPTRDAHATDAMYAQAWGLFRFLYQEHRDVLSLYLDDLHDLPTGDREATALRQEFTRRFGPIEQVEKQWRAWASQETTPAIAAR